MSHNHYNTDIIGLQDKSLIISNVQREIINDNNVLVIYVSKDKHQSYSSCVRCGSLSIKTHAYHTRIIKHLEIAGFNSIIKYKQRRLFVTTVKRHLMKKMQLFKRIVPSQTLQKFKPWKNVGENNLLQMLQNALISVIQLLIIILVSILVILGID